MKQVLMCKVSSYAIWLVHVTASSVNLRPVSHTLNDVVQECETGRDEGNMHMQFLSCIYINLKKWEKDKYFQIMVMLLILYLLPQGKFKFYNMVLGQVAVTPFIVWMKSNSNIWINDK